MKIAILKRINDGMERVLPMTLGSFFLFLIILYFIFLVGKTTWSNYQSNQLITQDEAIILELQNELKYMADQINYYQTNSYREKEARAKLGYHAPGEQMMGLPLDQANEELDNTVVGSDKVRTPNYILWWEYFFGTG